VLTQPWQWILETGDLLFTDKSDYPLLMAVLFGRIAIICAVIGCPFVIWGYVHKLRQGRKSRSQGNTDP
jgi:hypothetical protein